jgi:hypothetical protein
MTGERFSKTGMKSIKAEKELRRQQMALHRFPSPTEMYFYAWEQ